MKCKMTIEIKCAWCGKHLGEKPGESEVVVTSHGICDDCLAFLMSKAGEP